MSVDLPAWFEDHVPPELITSSLFRFVITTSTGVKVNVELTKDIDITYEDVELQLKRTPAQYTYWAVVYSEARAMISVIERRIKVRKAKLAEETSKQLTEAGIRVTDKYIGLIIEGDDVLEKLETALIVANKNAGKLYHMLLAIGVKADNLRSLSGFKKQDRDIHKL